MIDYRSELPLSRRDETRKVGVDTGHKPSVTVVTVRKVDAGVHTEKLRDGTTKAPDAPRP